MWGLGWAAANGGLLLAQVGAMPFVDHDMQIDLAFGAGTAAVGVASTLASPVTWLRVPDDCDQIEQVLARAAADEAFGRSFWLHAGNVLVNGGAALALGLGWDRWRSAALNGSVGILIGEIMIFTQPDGAVHLAVAPSANGAVLFLAGAF